MSNRLKKILLLVLVIGYILSPTDALPGPVDDLIVMLLGMFANGKLKRKS